MTKLLNDIRSDVETGTSLSSAFRKHPLHFDSLYCNLVEAGEAGGILEALLDRLAIYQEKTMAIKSQDQVGADVPDRGAGGGLRGRHRDHDLRDPGLQGRLQVLRRRTAGADAVRDRDVGVLRQYWWAIFGLLFGGMYFFFESWKRSEKMQIFMDRLLLRRCRCSAT
jgi:type IV pilus assembly protein PilC